MTLILIISVLFFVLFISWMYVFNVYEVKFVVSKSATKESNLVYVYPKLLNSFGMQIPFRKTEAEYKIFVNRNNLKLVRTMDVLKLKFENQNSIELICSTKFNLFPEKLILFSK